MNRFLAECRRALNQHTIRKCLVIGNESCDLDSAVCAIGLAYHLHHNNLNQQNVPDPKHFIPALCVSRGKLPLKSEVVHFLRKNDISPENLICMDELDLSCMESFILVDHHVSAHDPQKIEMVFDHRPRHPGVQFSPNCEVTIENVGSCATLIAQYILRTVTNVTDDEKIILKLLRAPIIVDTINFSPEADKARPLDHEMIQKIDSLLEIRDVSLRKGLFDELVKARCDVSQLSAYQILFKDMKLIGNTQIIAIPGYPIRVQEYIRMPEAEESVRRFAVELNCDVVVLMGMKFVDGRVLRDLCVVNIKNLNLFGQCQQELIINSAQFEFEEVERFMGGPVLEQRNVKLSRKQVMPILNKLLMN